MAHFENIIDLIPILKCDRDMLKTVSGRKIAHRYFHPKMPHFSKIEFGFLANFCLLLQYILPNLSSQHI